MKSPEDVTGQSPQSSAESKDTSHDPPQRKPRSRKAPGAENTPAQREAPAVSKPPTSKDRSEPEAERKKWTQSEKYHFWLNVFLAVIGVIALFIYYRQLEEMRKSTDAATKAATAAEESIKLTKEMSRLDRRAWVAPMAIAGKPEIDKPFSIKLTVQNTGKSFAKKVILVFAVEGVRDEKGPNFTRAEQITPEQPVKSVNLIAPNAVVTATRSLKPDELTAEDIEPSSQESCKRSPLGKSSIRTFLILNIGRPSATSSTLPLVGLPLTTNTTKPTTIAPRERTRQKGSDSRARGKLIRLLARRETLLEYLRRKHVIRTVRFTVSSDNLELHRGGSRRRTLIFPAVNFRDRDGSGPAPSKGETTREQLGFLSLPLCLCAAQRHAESLRRGPARLLDLC